MPDSQIGVEQLRRPYSWREFMADGFVHAFGLAAGLIGAVILVVMTSGQSNPFKLVSITIYAAGLVAMLSASAAYNFGYNSRWRVILHQLDHSAIFLMIAGTCTPFATLIADGTLALVFVSAIWAVTLGGIAARHLMPYWFSRVNIALYLTQGWIAGLAFGPSLTQLPPTTVAGLFAGGVLYTAGVIFHLWENLPFQNAIWHAFVLSAAVCHYLAILEGIVLTPLPS